MWMFTLFVYPQAWNNFSYRVRRAVFLMPRPINYFLYPLCFIIDRFFTVLLITNIPATAQLGPEFYIAHVGPVTVGKHTIAGRGLFLRQGVTIGGNGKDFGHPVFGDYVVIGANATVVGPIKVGNRASIGANTFLNKDLPDDGKVVGGPVRLL